MYKYFNKQRFSLFKMIFSSQLLFSFLNILKHQSRPLVHYPSFAPFLPPTFYTHPLLCDKISWEQWRATAIFLPGDIVIQRGKINLDGLTGEMLANKRESLSIDFYTEGNHHYILCQKLTQWSAQNTINRIFS